MGISKNMQTVYKIIENVRVKMGDGESIKTELFLLKDLYEYRNEEDSGDIDFSILGEIIPEFEAYHEDYVNGKNQMQRDKMNMKLKIQKKAQYMALWDNESIFYKKLHWRQNPYRKNFSKIDLDTLNTIVERLEGRSK